LISLISFSKTGPLPTSTLLLKKELNRKQGRRKSATTKSHRQLKDCFSVAIHRRNRIPRKKGRSRNEQM